MNVLVINCGSSSLKYQLIDSETENVLAKGLCERIGIDGRLVYQKAGCDKEITEAAMPTHKEAIQMVLDALTNDKTGAIGSLTAPGKGRRTLPVLVLGKKESGYLSRKTAQNFSILRCFYMERVKGVEPSSPAWKADVLAVVRHPH